MAQYLIQVGCTSTAGKAVIDTPQNRHEGRLNYAPPTKTPVGTG